MVQNYRKDSTIKQFNGQQFNKTLIFVPSYFDKLNNQNFELC